MRVTKRQSDRATKGAAAGVSSTPSSLRRCVAASLAPGFTMAELLIVIGIIVLVLALAVPAFNVITGSRSTDAASNTVAAMLARARTEAIGLQQTRGVFFYINPQTEAVSLALVQDAGSAPSGFDVLLDLTPDRDVVSLPRGVMIQTIDDGGGPAASTKHDRYIGFNTTNNNAGSLTRVAYGGVILFDARGQLTSRIYALRVRAAGGYTPMGLLLYQPTDAELSSIPAGHKDVWPVNPVSYSLKALRSQLGFVLFDREAFINANGDTALQDWQIVSPGSNYVGAEVTEEAWLDQNATPVLINRYSGALVKGE